MLDSPVLHLHGKKKKSSLKANNTTATASQKPLNKSNAEQHVTFLTTTLPEHQGALQAWSTNSSGTALRQEEETTDSLCCIGSSMDWSTYIQTATYNRVTEEQEGNIVSTKKEPGVRPTAIPSSQEQSGTGTCYHLGQHQRRHWRDSGHYPVVWIAIQINIDHFILSIRHCHKQHILGTTFCVGTILIE